MSSVPKPSKSRKAKVEDVGEPVKIDRSVYFAPTTGRMGRCLSELAALGKVSRADIEAACLRHNIKTVRFAVGHCRKLNILQSSTTQKDN